MALNRCIGCKQLYIIVMVVMVVTVVMTIIVVIVVCMRISVAFCNLLPWHD